MPSERARTIPKLLGLSIGWLAKSVKKTLSWVMYQKIRGFYAKIDHSYNP
jgi:hypothetical protein